MHLKRLEAFGFKSFADRTVFEFEHGVTGIVGPNGCGKSNVVDAMKWALGEQRPTSIRGSEMGDVLFAGSGGRKPLGVAEVSLFFANEDRFLPTETDEVVLTRRLYRDGTSEYLINKQLSRLKDIRELMMDTGGGRGALSILEQGKIDAVLQENPVERRQVFEEAAGVSRYRQRQKETTRKIEQMDDNLARLRDIIKVGEKQLRSIRAQAGRAERFRTLEKELRARRIELGLHRYERLLDERAEATGRVEDLASQEEAANARLADASSDLSGKEREVDQLRASAATLEAAAGKAEGAAEAALERASSADTLAGELEGRIQWYEGEIEVTLRRLEEAQEQADLSQRDEDAADADVETQDEALAEADAAITSAVAALREAEEAVASFRTEALELLDRKGRLANARARAAAEEESLRARGIRIAARREEVSTLLRDAETGEAGAREAAATTGHERDGASRALREQEEAVSHGEARLEDLRGRQASLDRAVSAARSRLDVLTSLRDRHEGVSRGVRRVLEEANGSGDGLRGVRGVLADLVEADIVDAEAVELALGPAAEGIVVDTFDDARRAITLLKEEGIGRALFLPLDHARSVIAAASVGEVVARPASSAIRCSDELRPLVDAVLAGTWLVEDLDGARGLAASMTATDVQGRFRAVTGGGEVLAGDGGLSGGRGDGAGHGMLARNAEIRTLTQRLRVEERRLDGARKQVKEAEVSLDETRRAAAEARQALRRLEESAATASARAERLSSELHRARQEAGVLDGEAAEVDGALAGCAEEIGSLGRQVAEASQAEADLETRQEVAYAAATAARDVQRQAEENRSEVRVERARAMERRESARQRRQGAERVLREGERNLHLARIELDNCRGRREESLRTASTARSEAEESRKRRETSIRDLARARSDAQDAVASLEAARSGVAELDEQYRSYRGALEELRLKEHETRMRLDHLLERMREEVRVDLEELHGARAAREAAAAEALETLGEDADTELEGDANGEAGGTGEPSQGSGDEQTAAAVSDDAPAPESPEVAVPQYEADEVPALDADFDEEAAELAINEIRSKMERMGNVNLEALDQIDDLESHAGGLREQEQDLVKARVELMEALRILNKESRERFVETFHRIREHFKETFRRLFGGGKADIFLDEGVDVLEAGVEIVARPPGKELRSISLLSGGERTMTAVAMLFAIYRAKPSPFCILDEVDAALDESNIDRFVGMLRSFLDRSQFIIITHSKRTMSTCDRLYGISMPEPGVSTRVRLELDQVSDAEITEAA